MKGSWFLASLALVLLPKSSDAADVTSMLEAMCPEATRELEELEASRKAPHVPARPSRPALRENLLLMAAQDQEARAFTLSSGLNFDFGSPEVMQMHEVDVRNLRRLKQIIAQEGFPTAAMVGLDGVGSAWLVAIHVSDDPDFQEQVLKQTAGHVRRGEVRGDEVAMLTDDLLAGRGKPQRYGTNFEMRDGELKPTPMEDEANVDKRRKSVGLGTLANYACILRAMYSPAEPHP